MLIVTILIYLYVTRTAQSTSTWSRGSPRRRMRACGRCCSCWLWSAPSPTAPSHPFSLTLVCLTVILDWQEEKRIKLFSPLLFNENSPHPVKNCPYIYLYFYICQNSVSSTFVTTGNTVYHLSATLNAMANPLMAFLAMFLPCHSRRLIEF